MTPERWQQVAQLFETAVAHPAEQRAEFLKAACGTDHALRSEVEQLLASDEDSEKAFDDIASGVAASWATQSESDDLLGQTLGRYRILSRLGTGGMGEVLLAEDAMLHRKVALKLLPRQFTTDRDRLRRFEQEARAASALNHPNIITIYEIGEVDGTRFIASEYVEGQTLAELARQRKLPLGELLDIGSQVAGALAAAHTAGIVHRDIKPANIMLRADGFAKVLDFGLAKLVTAARLDVTEAGRVMGTINYMSPEQAMGQPLDQRTDIFSLGVVLYELATGERLFEGQSEAAVYDCILHKPTPSIRQFAATSPEELDHVIRRALEKDPARRYQTAAALREDLQRLVQGRSATEATLIQSREQRAARRSRMTRRLAAAAAIVAVLGVALFAGSRFEAQRNAAIPNETAKKSIAVLPFVDLSEAKDQEYLCDGISEELLVSLGKVEGLRVAARTSAFSFKGTKANASEIARQLGVEELLEGSIRRDGNRIRLTAELVNARDGLTLWSEKFDRELQGVFAVQDEITRAIVDKLKVKLALGGPAPEPRNAEAHDLYLRGLYFSNKSGEADLRRALGYFQQALDQDPNFSSAWSGMAKVWSWLADEHLKPLDGYPAVEAAARRALELNPNDAEARCFLAEAQWVLNWDLTGAEAQMQQTLAVDPNSATAHWLFALFKCYRGDFALALQHMASAERLDPLSPVITNLKTNMLIWCGRLDEARAAAERTIELDPSFLYAGSPLARVYIAQERFDEALPLYEKAAQNAHHPSAGLGITYAGLGRTAEAREVLRQLLEETKTTYYAADEIARVPAALGDYDEALTLLQKAFEQHSANLPNAAFHLQFKALHSDPRFRDLLQKINLDPALLYDRER